MNKIVLTTLLLAIGWQMQAQTSETTLLKRHELKVDVASLLNTTLKVEYEYLLNNWSSVGAVALYHFDSSNDDLDLDFGFDTQVLGTYRLFFGKKPVSGFFLEANCGITSGLSYFYDEDYYANGYYYEGNFHEKREFLFGVGIALGWKFHIPQPNIVLDLFIGGGRFFGDAIGAYPRTGICIGKRF